MYEFPEWRPRIEWRDKNFDIKPNIVLEVEMNLAKKYRNIKLDDSTKLAYELGAMDDKGNLTEEGKSLLLDILIEDEKIKERFISALKQIKDRENED